MISPSKLRYVGIVLLMMGLGFSILTVMRGLPTYVSVAEFGLPGNSTFPLFMPSMWPPRSIRIAIYLSKGEIDLLIFDRPNYDIFMRSGNAIPLKEFKGLRGGVVNLEIPIRGEYYIAARNSGASTINGEIVLTFWGFEKDIMIISAAASILGIVFLVARYLMGKICSSKRFPTSLGKPSLKTT